MNRHVIFSIIAFGFIVIATVIFVLYGKGYRFGFDQGKIELSGTGLLVAKSIPDGAQVFLNDNLTTATNNTINLSPKEYRVRIFKEGYSPWEKSIKIQKEVVSKAEALLFPTAPKLESITDIGVSDMVIDPSHTKIAFTVASESARRNGVYILDMSSRPILTLQSAYSQIADDTFAILSQTHLSWSPDGRELIATVSASAGDITYLLDASGFNSSPTNITALLDTISANFETEKKQAEQAQISSLSKNLRSFVNSNILIIAWSPDETKILYKATESAAMPIFIKPRIIGANSTPEDRNIKSEEYYIYDIKEDRNYKLSKDNFDEHFIWFPDSRHIIFVKDQKLQVSEYDGGNPTVFYAGPFIGTYAFPWPDGSRIVILSNLGNLNVTPRIYTVGIR
ncbi:MAG: hypothetical protein UU21_C0015G0003 [Candidatus Levybacteria bacterium GW2011_GWA2_40_8]|nr:MAG: hypothetical protein UU21_C0015G0003 [Candidatus Levybacteria bacterium GW2011_GWA2_40_8]